MVDTTTTRVTTIGLGTGDHGSTADAGTTVIEAVAIAAEAVESLGVPGDAGAGAGPVAAVVADDC